MRRSISSEIRLHERHILIVADLATRAVVRPICEAQGYLCVDAAEGEVALRVLHILQVKAIVLDAEIHGLPALEVVRRVRAAPGYEKVPVIALAPLGGAGLQLIEAGAAACVIKPIDKRELTAVLERHLPA